MSDTTSVAAGTKNRRRRGWLFAAVALVGVVGLGVASVWFYVLGPQPPMVSTVDAGPGVAEDIAEAQTHVRFKPFSADAWGNLGIVLHLYEYFDEAGTCYAQAAWLAPRSPRWPYLQAVIQLHSDQKAALPLLEHSVRLGGTVQTPRLVLGETLLLENQTEKAEKLFQSVLDAEPKNARAWLGLGRAVYQRGDLENAVTYLKRSAEEAPHVAATHALLAQVLHRQGNLPGAARYRSRAASLPEQVAWPDPYRQGTLNQLRGESAVIFRATSLRQHGENKQALALLTATLQRYPQSYSIYRAMGRTYVALEDYDEAVNAYRQSIQIRPESTESQFECGRVLLHQGETAAASKYFREATRLQPEFGEAHYYLGRCSEILGRDAEAIAAYRNAVRFQPELTAAYQSLGALLCAQHEDVEALKILQHAVELDPAHEPTQKYFTLVQGRTKNL